MGVTEEPSPAQLWFWRTWTVLGVLLIAAGTIWVLREPLGLVVPPLALALVAVYLLDPAVARLDRRGLPRLVATGVVFLAGMGLLALVVLLAGPVFADQVGQLLDELPGIAGSVQDSVNNVLAGVGTELRVSLDPGAASTQEAIRDFIDQNRDQLLDVLRGAGSVVNRLFHLLLTLVLAPFLTFYLLADLPRITRGISRLVPPDTRPEVVEVTERIVSTVGAYFRGILMVAVFVGVATALGLGLIGLPFWAVIGAIAGAFNLIPLVGPFVGGALGVTVALTVGDGLGQAVAVVLVMTLVQQIDNHVITPNIVARTVHVHPVTVIVGLTFGGALFGVLGLFIAIPVIAALKLLIVYVVVTRMPSMSHLASGAVLAGDETEAPDGTVASLARELWHSLERRRNAGGQARKDDEVPKREAEGGEPPAGDDPPDGSAPERVS